MTRPRTNFGCLAKNCERPAWSAGLCAMHYHRRRRGKRVEMIQEYLAPKRKKAVRQHPAKVNLPAEVLSFPAVVDDSDSFLSANYDPREGLKVIEVPRPPSSRFGY